jgi:hypothetical protein
MNSILNIRAKVKMKKARDETWGWGKRAFLCYSRGKILKCLGCLQNGGLQRSKLPYMFKVPFVSSKRTKGQILRVLIWQVWEENHRSLHPNQKVFMFALLFVNE